jgi:hypothetical protein
MRREQRTGDAERARRRRHVDDDLGHGPPLRGIHAEGVGEGADRQRTGFAAQAGAKFAHGSPGI